MMKRSPISRTSALLALSALVMAPSAWAGSFYIQEQSISGLGAANAGQNATGFDASTVFTNPAGMTNLTRSQFSAGGSLLVLGSKIRNEGSSARLPAALGGATVAITGKDGDDPNSPALVPATYGVWVVNDDVRLGFGVNAPFGLVGKYDQGWFGRYNSQKSKLETINISLVGAYKVSPKFSVGGGIDIQRARAVLTGAVPAIAGLQGLSAAQSQAFIGSVGGVGGLYNSNTDSLFTVDANGYAVGANLGLTWKPVDELTVGLTYRSRIKHTVEGDFAIQRGATNSRSGPAEISVTTPDIIGLGAAWRVNPKWELLAQANYFHWSNFDKIDIKSNGTTVTVEQQDYKNSYSLALGFNYKWSDALILRAGTQFDKTPTTDQHRSTRVPDGNRIWLSVGASYDVTDNISIDAAYAHIFVEDVKVDQTSSTGVRTRATQTDGSVDILSMALRYKF
jgi:long-chain fatty acid transport protein